MPLARADLESLLRARQLDRTLTTALPPVDPRDEYAVGADRRYGAWTRGWAAGFRAASCRSSSAPRSSGRTSLLLQMLAAATARGELVALVDALDMLDVESAAAAGVDLDRLLWIRGHVVTNPGLCRDLNQRAHRAGDPRAHARAAGRQLRPGRASTSAEAPADAVRRLPFTTWLRLQRMVEGSQTACVLVGTEPMARSSAGLTLANWGSRAQGSGLQIRRAAVRRSRRRGARRPRPCACARGGERCPQHVRLIAVSRSADPQSRAQSLLYACLYRPPAARASSAAPRSLRLVAIAQEFSPRYERHRDDLVSIDVSGLGAPARPGADDRRGAAPRGGRARRARARRRRRHAHGRAGARASRGPGSRSSRRATKPTRSRRCRSALLEKHRRRAANAKRAKLAEHV